MTRQEFRDNCRFGLAGAFLVGALAGAIAMCPKAQPQVVESAVSAEMTCITDLQCESQGARVEESEDDDEPV